MCKLLRDYLKGLEIEKFDNLMEMIEEEEFVWLKNNFYKNT